LFAILNPDDIMKDGSSDEEWFPSKREWDKTEFCEECYRLLPPCKHNKKEHVTPILSAEVNCHLGRMKLKPARVVCDSGALALIITKSLVSNLRIKKSQPVRWQTKAGVFETNEQVVIKFQLPELSKSKMMK